MEGIEKNKLTYFKVESFKGIESLEFKDLGKINLILGDNNVGKSSVLEALLFDENPYVLLSDFLGVYHHKSELKNISDSEFDLGLFWNANVQEERKITFIYSFEDSKEKLELADVDMDNPSQTIVDNLLSNTHVDRNEIPLKALKITKNGLDNYYTYDFRLHRSKKSGKYYPFVKTGLAYGSDLVEFFSKTVNVDISLKKDFISNIQFLSEGIADITIDTTSFSSSPILVALFDNGKKPLPIFMMGDGTIRLIRLILEIMVCGNQRLMIDEIDNGIHFSKLKSVWEVVLSVANKYETQLFITTHDAECLRAFKEVLEDNSELRTFQKDVASYTLFKNKQKRVEAVRYNFEEFEHALDHSISIRG